MKKAMKGISIFLAVAMLFTLSMPVFAADTPSQKEEVIYILTDANGAVKNINAVNIFGGGDITDYGDYSSLKLLTAGNAIKQNGDMITFSSDADKVYYQGTMKDVEIPWNISIRYYIDGNEYSAQDVAGKSGKLEIKFKISENTKCKETFFNSYALQATITLNANNCANIVASGATEANVGKNKQLMYTILPGKGIDGTITADVTDFEMDPISINGIKLNLNIEIDNEALMDEVKELIDGVIKVNDGANSLKNGTSELKTGSSDLKGGTSTLKSGSATLDDGIGKLQEGISFAKDGLNTLNSKSGTLVSGSAEVKTALQTINNSLSGVSVTADKLGELTAASGEIKKGIAGLYEGLGRLQSGLGYAQYKAVMMQNGLDINALQAGNAQAISDLSAQIGELKTTLSQIDGAPGFEGQVAQLNAQIGQLQNIVTLLTGNSASFGGTESYLNELSGAVGELYSGMAELKEKYDLFDAAVSELANTLAGMLTDLSELASGINTLTGKYSELDSGIREYTGGVAQLVAGYSQIIDGVSDLAKGSKDLSKGSNDLYDGANKLYDGVIELCDGANELADGTKEMREKTTGMDTKVQDKIDEMLASIKGNDGETISFVSDKNTNVDSVQFVIRTDAIEKAETAAPPAAAEESLSLWQKFLRLFGWY